MTCKKHCTDLSSIIGVCASCLRQRLISVIIAEEQSETQSTDQNSNSNTNPTVPRSGSPYISRRKSMKSINPTVTAQRPCNKPRLNHSVSDRRFYNSPQIAIATGGCIGSSSCRKNPTATRFPSISKLFKSNSRNVDADSNPRVSVSTSSERSGATSSPSWLSNVLPGAGVRQKNTIASACVVRKQRCVRDRGMSPVRSSEDEEFSGGSSGCESAASCKQTPTLRCGGGQTSVTDMIFRPLVRASPNRLLSINGRKPVDGGFYGDVRAQAAPHISYVKSFSGNRSRKLADFGRSDPNRF